MKNKHLLVIIFICTFISNSFPFDYEAYTPTTIAKIINNYSNEIQASCKLDNVPFEKLAFAPHMGTRYRITVKYLGEVRQNTKDDNEKVFLWCKGYKVDYYKLYNHSILIQENNKKYWFPIQDILVPYLQKEINKNQDMMIYALFVGYIKKEYVFLINEFRKI